VSDAADDLRAVSDLWPIIAQYLPETNFALDRLEAKFRKGDAEHNRGGLDMSRAQLEAEVEAEHIDLALYAAMLSARFGPDASL